MDNYKQISILEHTPSLLDQINQNMGQSLSCHFSMVDTYSVTQNAGAFLTSRDKKTSRLKFS